MDASPELSVGAAAPGGGPLPQSVAGLVRTLSVAVLLQWAGAGALLPLLPLYVRHRGGSDVIVGAVMAAYFAAAFVFQYGAGRLSDRLGRLPVLVGGVLAYALGSLLFLLPGPAALDVVFRGLQGAGAGGAMVAALAMIAHAVPLSHRGRAAGRLYGAELGGLAVGPVLGSIAGLGAMRWLFVAAAVVSLVSLVPVALVRSPGESGALRAPELAGQNDPAEATGGPLGAAALPPDAIALPPDAIALPPDAIASSTGSGAGSGAGSGSGSGAGSGATVPAALTTGPPSGGPVVRPPALDRRRAGRAVNGALVAAAMIGVTSGVYEACWTLLMTRHGASQWQIGVSWTLFAFPFAAMSRPAGWLADHLDRRVLAVAALIWSICFLATYPFVPGYVLLMVLGAWESLGFAIAMPACQSLLGQGTSPDRHGHAQGLFAASQTGATAVAAACAGGLFGLVPWLPFVSAAGCCTALVVTLIIIWRPVPGRVPPGVMTTEGPATLAAGG